MQCIKNPSKRFNYIMTIGKVFFVKGQILDVERRKRFLAKLQPKLKELLVVCTYQNMDEFLSTTLELVKVLGKIKETPYELL